MAVILTERVSCCPACGSSANRFWATAHDRLHQTTSQEFEYSRCLDCHSLFQSLRPAPSEVWKCYPDSYGPHAGVRHRNTLTRLPNGFNRIANRLAERITGVARFRRNISEAEKHLKNAGTMLDFGCGSGKYLDRAKKCGCMTIGMDFSAQALEQVRNRGHKTILVDDEAWNSLGTDTIGFVRMNHVIEHLYQPEQVLKRIFSAMAPDAVLHLSTPNPVGPSATRYRAAWWGLECPRHIVLLPPERMVALLEETGFCQIQVLHEPITKDIVRSWAYTQVDRGVMTNERVEGLADDGLLNLWFSAVRFTRKRGRGTDRYHVIARKGNNQ